MFKKSILLLLVSMLLVVSSCSSEKKPVEPKELTLFHAIWSDEVNKIFVEAKQLFEKNNVGVKVNLRGVRVVQYFVELDKLYANHTPPDLIIMGPAQYSDKKGYLLDLKPLMKTDNTNDAFDENLLSLSTVNNKLIGIPLNATPVIVAYNKAWYQKANLPFPQDHWTWDDFIQDAIKLKSVNGAEESNKFGAVFPGHPFYMEAIAMSNGGGFINPDGSTVTGALDSDKTVEGIEWLRRIIYDQKISPYVAPDIGKLNDWFTNEAGLVMIGYDALGYISPEAKSNIGIVGLPTFKGSSRVSFVVSSSIAITEQTKNPELAWKFLKLIAIDDNEITKQLLEFGANTSNYLSRYVVDDPFHQVLMNEIKYAKDNFYSLNSNYFYILPMLARSLENIMVMGADPKEILSSAAKNIDLELEKLENK